MEEILATKNATIVDVRERSEFLDFNIGGLNVPAHLVNEHLEQLQKFDVLIIVCSNGSRSHILTRVFQKKLPKKIILHLEEGIF